MKYRRVARGAIDNLAYNDNWRFAIKATSILRPQLILIPSNKIICGWKSELPFRGVQSQHTSFFPLR